MPETDPFAMFDLPNQPEDTKPAPAPVVPAPGTVTLSQAQFDELMASQRESARRNQELMATLFTGNQQTQRPAAPEIAIDLNGLPDPRDDFEGYNRGLAERLGTTIQTVRNVVRQELTDEAHNSNQQVSLMNQAWSRFGELHSDLAAFPEVVETATSAVFGELRQRGVDPMALMSRDMDDIVNRVAERSKATVNRIRGVQDDGDEPAGRTAMLEGAAPKPRGRAKAEVAQPNDFVSDLKKLQQEMRIY